MQDAALSAKATCSVAGSNRARLGHLLRLAKATWIWWAAVSWCSSRSRVFVPRCAACSLTTAASSLDTASVLALAMPCAAPGRKKRACAVSRAMASRSRTLTTSCFGTFFGVARGMGGGGGGGSFLASSSGGFLACSSFAA